MAGPAPQAPNATTSQYVLPNQNKMASNYQNYLSSFVANNPYANTAGTAKSVLNMNLNNPTTAAMQSGENLAGAMGTGAAANSYNSMDSLLGAAPLSAATATQEATAANPYYSTSNLMLNEVGALPGADQNLYNYMNNENNNQVNASLAARGLNASGAGANISAQEQQLFNEQWQNYLTGLQATGISAASTAANTGSALDSAANSGLSTYGNLLGAASNLGSQAYTQQQEGAMAPYTAYETNINNLNNALGNYSAYINAGNQNTQAAMTDALNYLGMGQTSNNNMTNAQLGTYNAQLGQYNANLSNNLGTVGAITSGIGTAVGLGQNIAGGLSTLGSS